MRNYLMSLELNENAKPFRSTLEKLRGIADRMERLTRELRQFSQPRRGRKKPVDLRLVAEGARELMSHDFDAAGVALVTPPAGAPLTVAGDAMALEQAVTNLLRNALAAVTEQGGGRVRLSIALEDAHAAIVVADDGPGIGETTIERLTEPFHTTRASGEGMGLGLAIVAEILKDHGGALSAVNRPGGGAAFTIRLPILKGALDHDDDAPNLRVGALHGADR